MDVKGKGKKGKGEWSEKSKSGEHGQNKGKCKDQAASREVVTTVEKAVRGELKENLQHSSSHGRGKLAKTKR